MGRVFNDKISLRIDFRSSTNNIFHGSGRAGEKSGTYITSDQKSTRGQCR